MFYFSVDGDNHMFKFPLSYLEKICNHFYCNKFGDNYDDNRLCRVHYAMDVKLWRLKTIQLVCRPDCFDFASLITIDFEYCTDSQYDFLSICPDRDKVVFHCKFYHFTHDDKGIGKLCLLDCEDFSSEEFINDYFEDMDSYDYDCVLFDDEYIEDSSFFFPVF